MQAQQAEAMGERSGNIQSHPFHSTSSSCYFRMKTALVVSLAPLKAAIGIGVVDHFAALDNGWNNADASLRGIGLVD